MVFGQGVNLHWYSIDRKEVENKDFRGITKLIKTMQGMGNRSCQSVNLTFDGYDHVPDEIFEINEIRQYVKVLLQKYPDLFYYLSQNYTQCLQNIILCYADFETVFFGEKKAIADYPMEDIMNGNLPEQEVVITVSPVKIEQWKKEIRKTARKYNDISGGERVCEDLEKIFARKV